MSVKDAAGNVTGYGYDTESNLTSITDASNHMTSFLPDSLGRITTVTFPSTLVESYMYDGVGNLTSKKDRNGNTITYNYDELNRLISKILPGTGSPTVTYKYDAASRLTEVDDADGSTYKFTYDGLGRLTQTTTTYSFLTGRNLTVSYTYDAASNRSMMTDAEGGRTDYAYDALNRLQTLSDFQSSQFVFSYDALSRRTQLTRTNGLNTSYNYDALSRLLSIVHQKQGSGIGGASYTYDNAGNRKTRTDLYHNTIRTYGYDNIYELKTAVYGTTTQESYTYDAVGNRTSSLGVAQYSYNSSNELTSQSGNVSYTYDNNGNLKTKVTSAGTTSYNWDFENRLTSVILPGTGGTVTFKYDPFGRRIYKSSSSGTSIYVGVYPERGRRDGDNQIEEVDASGAQVARYTQGLGVDELRFRAPTGRGHRSPEVGPLAMFRGGVNNYYHADGLGTILGTSVANGTYSELYQYDSFGKLLSSDGRVTKWFQYTAREFDTETGLYYYRARYYDPTYDNAGMRGEVQHLVDVLPSKCQRKHRIGETASLTGFTANRDGIEVWQTSVRA